MLMRFLGELLIYVLTLFYLITFVICNCNLKKIKQKNKKESTNPTPYRKANRALYVSLA